jgi:hypothetical protein
MFTQVDGTIPLDLRKNTYEKNTIPSHLHFEEPTTASTSTEWWTTERDRLRGLERKEFDTLVCMTSYALWKNRNAWTFGEVQRQHRPITLAALVAEEYNLIKTVNRGAGTGTGIGVGVTLVGE